MRVVISSIDSAMYMLSTRSRMSTKIYFDSVEKSLEFIKKIIDMQLKEGDMSVSLYVCSAFSEIM